MNNMKTNTTTSFGNLTDEQIAQLEAFGFPMEEIPEEPKTEEVKPLVEETKKPSSEFIFSFDMMDNGDSVSEKFVLNKLQEAMKQVFFEKDEEGITNSRKMARARFYISGTDENGLPYGNFNGAGKRAITMFQPEHPDAPQSGKNYGKVFYRWGDKRVGPLMDAIFEECGWDPKLLLEGDEE